jgi:glycyl-tRNA synthetase beta chain
VVGVIGIGQAPTGDKDPFALRRAALGVVRIMIERGLALDLRALLATAFDAYRAQSARIESGAGVKEQTYAFIMERLRSYYQEAGIGSEVFEAVFSRRPARPLDFDARIRAVQAFRALPEAGSLAAANKRIANILRKNDEPVPDAVDDALLREPAERALAAAVSGAKERLAPLIAAGDYGAVLGHLAGLRAEVDAYFDSVMVMCEETPLRRNRLALLRDLQQLFLNVADLSALSIAQSDPRER